MSPARCDLFEQLCGSIGLSDESLVALMDMEFYGDAGGNQDASNIALGGYVATVEQWKAIKGSWATALVDEGLDCFHRTDMESFWKGKLKEKNWDRDHQIAVLNRLHGIIKGRTIRGRGYAVKNKSFREIMPPEIAREYGGPYGWCVLLELIEVGLWARKRGHWVTYFFEAGDTGQSQAFQTINKLYNDPVYKEMFRINGWGFYPKKDDPKTGEKGIIQLQLADFIAYEAYKDIDDYIAGSPRKKPRASRLDLIRPKQDELRLWGDKPFAKWLARYYDLDGDVIRTLITTDPST